MPNRKLSVKKKTIFYFLIYILMWFSMYFLGVLFGKYSIYENTLGLLSIVACSWIAYRFRKNTSLFICFFFIAYSVYSIVFGVYLYPEIRPDWLYSQFSDNSVFVIGMQCIFLFSITMVYLVENGLLNDKIDFNNFEGMNNSEGYQPNWVIVFGCILIILYISLTEFTFHGTDARASKTPLYEYRTVFFIVGMIHSRNKKVGKYLWTFVMLLGVAPSLIGGNRVEAIALIIAYVYFYYNDVSPKKILPIILVAIMLMTSLGMYRQSILSGIFSFGDLWKKIIRQKFTFDTAYWAYPPSLASIAISKVDVFKEKVNLLWYQVLYIIQGGKYSEKLLTGYTHRIYTNYGGYVSPVYFYYWIGLLSPVVFALLVYAYIKLYYHVKLKMKNSILHHDLYNGVSAYFVAVVPRWFLYGPFLLIRGEAIMVTGIFLASIVSSAMLKKRKFNFT